MDKVVVEVNGAFAEADTVFGVGNKGVCMITPPLDGDYWLFRVPVSDVQAIVGFPKFFTVGIGFQHEEDWNTNLPYTYEAKEIYDHIEHNRGDDSITEKTCIAAIEAIQKAAALWDKRNRV